LRAFKDYAANGNLIMISVFICFTMAFFNGFGVAVTKNASSAQRATIDTARTLLIWIFFMAVEVNGKREDFHVLQLFGFLFLSIGTLVFNEIIVIKFFGFDQYTRPALLKREALDRSGILDHPPASPGGLDISPIAAKNEQRNKRALLQKSQ
jgi:hypothetical protein